MAAHEINLPAAIAPFSGHSSASPSHNCTTQMWADACVALTT